MAVEIFQQTGRSTLGVKSSAKLESGVQDHRNLEGGTDRLSRNVGKELPIRAA